MGPALFFGAVAGFIALLMVGRYAFIRDTERRIRDWARAEGHALERIERGLNLSGGPKITWRVRVVDSTGSRREAWIRSGGPEPLDVLWAAPGESVFR